MPNRSAAKEVEFAKASILDNGTLQPRPNSPVLPTEMAKRLRGQPTKYKPEYCDAVLEMSVLGYSLGGFAGSIGVDRATINEWIRVHPSFFQACSRAAAGRLWWWETKMIGAVEEGNGSASSMIIAGVMNASRSASRGGEDWVNKTEIEHSGSVSLVGIVERMIAKLEDAAQARSAPQPLIIEHEQSVAEPIDDDLFGGMDT